MSTHPATEPTSNHSVCVYVGAQLLWREPLPCLFDCAASFRHPVQNTTLDAAVLDSVVHYGTTIAGVNAKLVES